MKSINVKDFNLNFKDIISKCFVAEIRVGATSITERSILHIKSIKVLVLRAGFITTVFVILLTREPLTLISQFELRRNGGLSGTYQFHRLWEIRKLLCKAEIEKGIEFGSGASTIIFSKYIDNFVSIEESESWKNHYLNNLKFLKFFHPKLYKKIKENILVAARTEFLDSNKEVVCSYKLPIDISREFYDLAYVDGPTNWIQSDLGNQYLVRDPLKLLPNVSIFELSSVPRIVIVDGRRSTVSYVLGSQGFLQYNINLKSEYYAKQKFKTYHTFFQIEVHK